MECEKIRELLSAYLDGEATKKERKLIEEHLASCRLCAEELEELRRVVGLLRALPKEIAPEGFAQKTMARLPALAIPAKERLRKFLLRPKWAFASGALATAALIFVAIGIFYSFRPPRESFEAVTSLPKERVPSATVSAPAARDTYLVREAEPSRPEVRMARRGMGRVTEEEVEALPIAETEVARKLPTASEAIALAQTFKDEISAERKVMEEVPRVPPERFSRWQKEIAARQEREYQEKYKTQMASNLIANSFVQQKGIAGPQAQYIYLASRDLEKARKELEDILAFAEKNGRLAREEAGALRFRMRGGPVPIRTAPAEMRARISRPGPLPQGLVFTVGLTDEELDRVLEQAIWADNFITTGIEWPARPAEARRVGERITYAYDEAPERESLREEMGPEKAEEDVDADGHFWAGPKKPLSQTVLILLEEEK